MVWGINVQSETNFNVLLTQLHAHHTRLHPACSHPPRMPHQPPSDILDPTFHIDLTVPQPLSKHTAPNPYLLVPVTQVGQLTPHTYLSSNHIHIGITRLELIKIPPCAIGSIIIPVEFAIAQIKIGIVIVGKNDLIRFIGNRLQILGQAPPMQHIIRL